MPVRLVREDILTSERIDMLDAPAEVFYRRLLSKVDDYGLYDARIAILRANLYPLRIDRVREADITRWIAACEKAGVIALYTHGGKPYLQVLRTKWQTRSEPKFPLPPWGKGEPSQTVENNCSQPSSVEHLDVFGDEDVFDSETTSLPEKAAPYRVPPCPTDEIVELYHSKLPMLSRVVALSDARKRAISARWHEVCGSDKLDKAAGLEFFAWYFQHASQSAFLTGKSKEWRADIDFLMTASKFAKVVEGAYHKVAA